MRDKDQILLEQAYQKIVLKEYMYIDQESSSGIKAIGWDSYKGTVTEEDEVLGAWLQANQDNLTPVENLENARMSVIMAADKDGVDADDMEKLMQALNMLRPEQGTFYSGNADGISFLAVKK